MRTGAIGKGMSLDARGKFGYSGGFGRIAWGYNRFGFYSWYAGIYQKMYAWGKPYISRKQFAWGGNPRTLEQQNGRAVFAYGVYLWQNASISLKHSFNTRAKTMPMSGYNLFLKQWRLVPTYGFGKILFGYNGFGLG